MFFRVFLVCYVVLLIVHTASLQWNSSLMAISMVTGFVVAFFAHTQYGALTIGLLLVHMTLEWLEYTRHCWHFSSREMLLHSVHASFDTLFLYQELRAHMKKYYDTCFLFVMCVLVFFFVIQSENRAHIHTHQNSFVESFVVGGMFGCIICHLSGNSFKTKRVDP